MSRIEVYSGPPAPLPLEPWCLCGHWQMRHPVRYVRPGSLVSILRRDPDDLQPHDAVEVLTCYGIL